MRRFSYAITSLVVASVTLPALAAEPVATCNGRTATITATAPGVVQGTEGADVIVVSGAPIGTAAATIAPVVVLALGGDDLICLSSNAANVVVGGDGIDTVSYEHAEQMVVASMNVAAVRLRLNLDTLPPDLIAAAPGLAPGVDLLPSTEALIGSPYADVLIGHVLNDDSIIGGAGDDIIVGLFGNDRLYGGLGNDSIVGDGYDEFTYGPIDGVTVGDVTTPILAPDDDLLDGGDGADSLNDDTGNNTFLGGAGNDGFSQGFGNDTIDGGPGGDHVSYLQAAATVDLNKTTPQDTGHGMDKLIGIEHITGSDQPDTLIGTPGLNILLGGPGDDRIAGSLTPSAVFDQLDGGAGIDVCHGIGTTNCECPSFTDEICDQPAYAWDPT